MKATLTAFAASSLAACSTMAPPTLAGVEMMQAGTTQQCSAAEFRQLDFWVGVWDVRWEASIDQLAGSGTNTITRQLNNCVIQERFEGGPSTGNMIGHSVSTYHAASGSWRQTWVDNQGGYFALAGGPDGGKFVLENSRLRETAPHLRMVFEDITPTSLTWRWQRSVDAGATWTDSWVIYYVRRPSDQPPGTPIGEF